MGAQGANVRAYVHAEDEMSEKIYDVPAEWAKRAYINDAKYKEMYQTLARRPERLLGGTGEAAALVPGADKNQKYFLRPA